MKNEFKLTAQYDKNSGLVHLIRGGKFQCLCPFRMPAVLPVPMDKKKQLTIVGGQQQQQFITVEPFCNSSCPHFDIQEVITDDMEEKNIVVLKCNRGLMHSIDIKE